MSIYKHIMEQAADEMAAEHGWTNDRCIGAIRLLSAWACERDAQLRYRFARNERLFVCEPARARCSCETWELCGNCAHFDACAMYDSCQAVEAQMQAEIDQWERARAYCMSCGEVCDDAPLCGQCRTVGVEVGA